VRRPAPLPLLCALALAAPSGAASLADVQACMQRNAPTTALVQTVTLVSTDRAGGERKYEARLLAKRLPSGLGRVRVLIEGPADVRGTSFLLHQKDSGRNDLYVYLPELKKVRRVTSRALRGKFLGSDFSYEDLDRLLSASRQSDVQLGADGSKDGRAVWTVEAVPSADSDSSYTRVVSSVDQETCVPLEIAFYAKGEAPVKVLSVDPAKVTREGAAHVPRLVRMRDLKRGTESRLETTDVALDPELEDQVFSVGALERGR
jgi:hypothetical protein